MSKSEHVKNSSQDTGQAKDKDKQWTFFSASQNLVSVLNDPSVARSYSDTIFTKEWGSNFADSPASQFVTFLTSTRHTSRTICAM